MTALTKVQKTNPGENKRPAASGSGEVMQGKPDVARIACTAGITAGETHRSLRAQQRQYCILSEDRHIRFDLNI